jgi:hypothetical protein
MKLLTQWRWFALLLSSFTLLFICSCQIQHHFWPPVKEISLRHHFEATKKNEQVRVTIYGRDSKPLYLLDARFCWRDYETGDYDFSGILDCRLYSSGGFLNYPTLLQNTTNATRDWQTYGRFTYDELIGLAGVDDSRRLVQQCWLRGMFIQIEVLNITKEANSEGNIASLDMVFSVKNSPSSNREIAARDAPGTRGKK